MPVAVAAGSGASRSPRRLVAAVAGEVADTVAVVCPPPNRTRRVTGDAAKQAALGVGVRGEPALVGAWPCRRSASGATAGLANS